MKKLLSKNPEIAKYVWLELSNMRLLAMPVILFLIFMVGMEYDSFTSGFENVHNISYMAMMVVGLIWGMKSSSDAVLDEHNDKTWDWQKMSGMSPWKLTVGKLFGSTIYNWYGALIAFVVFVFTSFFMSDPELEIKKGVGGLISIVTLHGIMILFSLQMVKRADERSKIKSGRIFIVGILIAGYLMSIITMMFTSKIYDIEPQWYFFKLDQGSYFILNGLFYASWVVAGIYRSMRAELQYSDPPNWWLTFIFTNFIFQYGLFIGNEKLPGILSLSSGFAFSFIQLIVLVYLMALSESKDIVKFKKLVADYNAGKWDSVMKSIPLWLLSLPIAFVFGLIAVLTLIFSFDSFEQEQLLFEFSVTGKFSLLYYLLALIGFTVRDLGVLLLLHFSTRNKRADASMVVFMAVMYIVMPLLFKSKSIGILFYPVLNKDILSLFIFPLIEAGVVVYVLVRRWKRLNSVK